MSVARATASRGIVMTSAVAISAALTGALVGLAWSAFSTADMGLWVLARAAGLGSYLLLTAVTVFGLLLARPPRAAARLLGRAQRLRLHIILAVFALVFTVLHVLALVVDPWAEVGWAGALLPMGAAYRPLPVTLGLLALWSGVISGATAALAGRGLGRIWLPLHRLSAAAWILAWLHGILAGSDTGAWLGMYLVTGLAVVVLVIRRVTAPTESDDLAELTHARLPREEVIA